MSAFILWHDAQFCLYNFSPAAGSTAAFAVTAKSKKTTAESSGLKELNTLILNTLRLLWSISRLFRLRQIYSRSTVSPIFLLTYISQFDYQQAFLSSKTSSVLPFN